VWVRESGRWCGVKATSLSRQTVYRIEDDPAAAEAALAVWQVWALDSAATHLLLLVIGEKIIVCPIGRDWRRQANSLSVRDPSSLRTAP
jgi:hypothetical protein